MALESGLKGKVALVTGGGTGLGRAIAEALADEGADVAIVGRRDHSTVALDLRRRGVRAAAFQTDLTDEGATSELTAKTVAEFGRLDLLVCDAATASHEVVEKSTTQAWEKTLLTNVLSTMWLCRRALSHMHAAGSGSILIVGSTAQFHRAFGQTAYHVSKAALAAFATNLAVEAAPSVRVNMLVPGRFPSGLNPAATSSPASDIPLGRSGLPQEVGPAAVFLLSDRLASYVTGAELVISGGLHLRPTVRSGG